MITCPDCKTVNDKRSKYCHKCGYPFASDPRANIPTGGGSIKKYALLAIAASVAALFIYSIVSYQMLSPEQKAQIGNQQRAQAVAQEASADHRADAVTACESAIGRQLKASSTASFSHIWDTKITGTGNGPYRIIGWVDAQNSFGAKLRNNYICFIERRAGAWTATQATLIPR